MFQLEIIGYFQITIDAARILGISNRVGSIEVGKDIDIVISSEHQVRPNMHWGRVGLTVSLTKKIKYRVS